LEKNSGDDEMSIKDILDNKKKKAVKALTIRLTAESAEIIEYLHKKSGWSRSAIINDLIESCEAELD
jgi:predicted DNA-binding protein